MAEVKEVFIDRNEALTLLALLGYVNKHKSVKYNLDMFEKYLEDVFDIGDVHLSPEFNKFKFEPADVRIEGNIAKLEILWDNMEIVYNG